VRLPFDAGEPVDRAVNTSQRPCASRSILRSCTPSKATSPA
jgi:hypothetical protein